MYKWPFSAYRDFSWSPSDNIIAYWVPEQQNVPARVTLIQMPSRQELCIKNLFNVADCKMHWQKNGDYLCVKVDRYSKAKKIDEKDQFKYSVSKDQFNAVYKMTSSSTVSKWRPIHWQVQCKQRPIHLLWT